MRLNVAQRNAALAAVAVVVLSVLVWTQTDLDGDALTAAREMELRTDSLNKDTDLDTVDDGWEHDHGLNPLSKDSDADGLEDRSELDNRTNPLSEDSDNDGVPDANEYPLGTDPRDSDTDDDTLHDSFELELTTNPLSRDTEGDGLPDADEVLRRGNPHRPDTDADGIRDAEEPREDCNANDFGAIADADDDSDQRTDGKEAGDERCRPDYDADGVLDGFEGNLRCIRATDCDTDGLQDGVEVQQKYNPLNSDTHETGLNDAIALAFQQNNQPPSRDLDDDGIPDAWEASNGLIDWGTMAPKAGQKDLLVEFLRVHGPHSGRYRHLDFKPAYAAVAKVFTDAGVQMQWTETVVELPNEDRPHFIPSSYGAYYEQVLARGRLSANPYVTTVVMNPQHDQSDLLHTGVAPIRGMLAAVDYGMHVVVSFQFTYIDDYYFDWDSWSYVPVYKTETILLEPGLESVIIGNRQDLIRKMGFLSGGVDGGGLVSLRDLDYRIQWAPYWFATNPVIVTSTGTQITMYNRGASVDTTALAHTILHEMGHTLGLCHAHDEECYAKFSPQDQFRKDQSTMSYASSGLMFLGSEWQTVGTYLTCPPEDSLASVARRAPYAQLIEEKYGYALNEVLNVDHRTCGQPTILTHDLAPDGEPVRLMADYREVEASELTLASFLYVLPWSAPAMAINSVAGTAAFAVLGLAVAGGAGYAALWMGNRGLTARGALDLAVARLRPRLGPGAASAGPTPAIEGAGMVQPSAPGGDAAAGPTTGIDEPDAAAAFASLDGA